MLPGRKHFGTIAECLLQEDSAGSKQPRSHGFSCLLLSSFLAGVKAAVFLRATGWKAGEREMLSSDRTD